MSKQCPYIRVFVVVVNACVVFVVVFDVVIVVIVVVVVDIVVAVLAGNDLKFWSCFSWEENRMEIN